MAQEQVYSCPRCGAPAVAGQSFCPNCGLKAEDMRAGAAAYQDREHQGFPQNPAQSPMAPATYGQSFSGAEQQGPSVAGPGPSPKKSRRIGRVGCISILALVLVILGIAGYISAGMLGVHVPGFSGPATQSTISTTAINSTITYASVDITVLNIEQSQNFTDDPNTRTDGMVRLNVREQNTTTNTVSYSYYDIARLILPDKTTVPPTYVKAKVGIASGVTQTSMLDFAVPQNVRVNQLSLRLGTDTEAQMTLPLTGKADLQAYQPRTVHPAVSLQYFGLNWMLATATEQMSANGQQASKNMNYVVLTLKVDNTLSQTAIIGSAYTYIRLKAGQVTASPAYSTLPVSFTAGATGKSGAVTFLVPQGTTSFTLILLAQNSNGMDQATADFQVVE